jgi:hypothetical protein
MSPPLPLLVAQPMSPPLPPLLLLLLLQGPC